MDKARYSQPRSSKLPVIRYHEPISTSPLRKGNTTLDYCSLGRGQSELLPFPVRSRLLSSTKSQHIPTPLTALFCMKNLPRTALHLAMDHSSFSLHQNDTSSPNPCSISLLRTSSHGIKAEDILPRNSNPPHSSVNLRPQHKNIPLTNSASHASVNNALLPPRCP